MTELLRHLQRLQRYAMNAEWDETAAWLQVQISALGKTEKERWWPLGCCVWCQVEANRVREATVTDSGGGPPMCEPHFLATAQ